MEQRREKGTNMNRQQITAGAMDSNRVARATAGSEPPPETPRPGRKLRMTRARTRTGLFPTLSGFCAWTITPC